MKYTHIALIIGCLVIILSACSHQATDAQVQELYVKATNGDATALHQLSVIADSGMANAQYDVGVIYSQGKVVPQDYDKAVSYFRKAADQGDSNAQGFLGSLYVLGHGVPKDYKQAFYWLDKSAAQGNAIAERELTSLHNLKLDKMQSPAEPTQPVAPMATPPTNAQITELETKAAAGDAVSLQKLTDLANDGNNFAEYALGFFYYAGKGVPKDDTKAVSWLQKAAVHNTNAGGLLAQIRRSHSNAGWKQPITGPDDADYEKALTYYQNGPSQNYILARQYFEKAAVAGDARAMYLVSDMYYQGQGGDKDAKSWEKAKEWMLKGANANYPPAMLRYTYYLRGMYFAADGWVAMVDSGSTNYQIPNTTAQWKWVQKAADLHYGQAENWIGLSYIIPASYEGQNPYGCSVEKGVEYLERAGADGVPGAYSFLSELYANVNLITNDRLNVCASPPLNYVAAMKYARLAQQAGDTDADNYLKLLQNDIDKQQADATAAQKLQLENTKDAAYTKRLAAHEIRLAEEAEQKMTEVKSSCSAGVSFKGVNGNQVVYPPNSDGNGNSLVEEMHNTWPSADSARGATEITAAYVHYPNIAYKKIDALGRQLFQQLAQAGCLYPGLTYPEAP